MKYFLSKGFGARNMAPDFQVRYWFYSVELTHFLFNGCWLRTQAPGSEAKEFLTRGKQAAHISITTFLLPPLSSISVEQCSRPDRPNTHCGSVSQLWGTEFGGFTDFIARYKQAFS